MARTTSSRVIDMKDTRCPPSFVKYVLKMNYDITGTLDITTCTECGKVRLSQEYESSDGSKSVWLCEQCTWDLTDEEYDMYYKEEKQ